MKGYDCTTKVINDLCKACTEKCKQTAFVTIHHCPNMNIKGKKNV